MTVLRSASGATPEPVATAELRVPCDECCWTPFCPDHRLRQDNDGSRCPTCNGTGERPA